MDATEVIAHINQERGTSYKIVGRYGLGESGVASRVVDDAGNLFVLKIGAGDEFRAESAARTTHRLRALGYPAPEYLAVGKVRDTSYTLQRELRGQPIGQRVSIALLPQLLRLNDLQRGQGESENDEPDRLVHSVMIGFPNFCNLATLRTYSTESAAMLDSLQRIVVAHAHECQKRNDIVHFDFHPNNILIEDDRITGVIDWESSVSGDCAFDLATMLFYTWPFEEFRDQLWCALVERTPRGAAAVYLAHMIVRQLDWSMRHHPREEVERYLRIGGDIIRAIRLP